MLASDPMKKNDTITSTADSNDTAKNTSNTPSTKRTKDVMDSTPTLAQTKPFVRCSVYGEHKRAVSSVKFAPRRVCKCSEKAIVASASASGSIQVWDLNEGMLEPTRKSSSSTGNTNTNTTNNTKDIRTRLSPTLTATGHARGINDIAWHAQSPLIASASDDKTVRVWDAVTGDALLECKGHDNYVFAVDMHDSLVASGSFDETVKLWDLRSAECVLTIPAHSDPVTAVRFNRDGTCVCSASHDGLARIWDVATGECFKTMFAAGNPPVSAAAYAPNSKYVLMATLDSALRLWPVTTTTMRATSTTSSLQCKTYKSEHHVHSKYSIACDFLYNGNLVTGSETGAIVVYDLQSRQVQQVLHGHDDAVLAVAAHDTMPLLTSGGMTNDRKVEFWVERDCENVDAMDVDVDVDPASKKAKGINDV